MTKNLYDILQIKKNATASEIKKAYKKLAKKYHPDLNKNNEAEENFKEINMAYEVLSDKDKKRKYDQYGDKIFNNGQNNSSFNQDDISSMFEEIFKNFSGGEFGFEQQQSLDIEAEISISISDAINGAKIPLETSTGNFTIIIPKGVTHNDKIRIKGKGRKMKNKTGDLFLYVKVVSDDNFKVSGYNLIKQLDIPLGMAIFGGVYNLNYMGKNIEVKIKRDTSFGEKIIIPQKGLKVKNSNKIGDLILIINIILPNSSKIKKESEKILKDQFNYNENESFSEKVKIFSRN